MAHHLTHDERAALERLLAIASRDTGQSKRVADFLLAWWNAEDCGGFDLCHLWNLDTPVTEDILTLIQVIACYRNYPDTYGYGPQFEQLVRDWRPHLVAKSSATS